MKREVDDSLSRIRENRNLARLECVFEYLRGFRGVRARTWLAIGPHVTSAPRPDVRSRRNKTNEEGRMTRFGKRKSIINSPWRAR